VRLHSDPLHCTPLHGLGMRHGPSRVMQGVGYSARGELVQHALLVGLAVQSRRHGEERVEAQQHLREYSEYQRPPARQHGPRTEYREYHVPLRFSAPAASHPPALRESRVPRPRAVRGGVGPDANGCSAPRPRVLWGYSGVLKRSAPRRPRCTARSPRSPCLQQAKAVHKGCSGGYSTGYSGGHSTVLLALKVRRTRHQVLRVTRGTPDAQMGHRF
jgi:hypothetical protein